MSSPFFQVKIRGFRIELDEIQSIILSIDKVAEVTVVVREDRPDDKRLIAYVVLKEKGSMSMVELKNKLKEKLPEFMIPSAFVVLDKLPLSPNGKVDKRALPVASVEDLGRPFVAPRTLLEETLASLACSVLGIGKIGSHQ